MLVVGRGGSLPGASASGLLGDPTAWLWLSARLRATDHPETSADSHQVVGGAVPPHHDDVV